MPSSPARCVTVTVSATLAWRQQGTDSNRATQRTHSSTVHHRTEAFTSEVSKSVGTEAPFFSSKSVRKVTVAFSSKSLFVGTEPLLPLSNFVRKVTEVSSSKPCLVGTEPPTFSSKSVGTAVLPSLSKSVSDSFLFHRHCCMHVSSGRRASRLSSHPPSDRSTYRRSFLWTDFARQDQHGSVHHCSHYGEHQRDRFSL